MQELKLLSASGEFNHQKAREFFDPLISALNEGTPVEIDLTQIGSVDLTSLQLLVAARRSFQNAGLPFHLKFGCSEEVFSLITNCGLAEKTGAKSM